MQSSKSRNKGKIEDKRWLFIVAVFKGISQVVLIENAITGLIILMAITIANYSLGIITLISALIGTWIGFVGAKDKTVVVQGIFGYNSVLTGLALSLYLEGSQKWAFAIIGAAVTALVTAAIMHILRNTGLPSLTLPYILHTWLWLLASFHLNFVKLSPALKPQDITSLNPNFEEGTIEWSDGLIDGIGQIYFVEYWASGILILIAICWASWRLGLCAIAGTAIGWLTAYGLGAEINMLNLGLYGFNAVLTILAVAVVFNTAKGMRIWMGIVAAMLTVPVAAGLGTWLNPYGLPALTMPFVLVTWIMIAARNVLPKY
ncbi:urea transporter [Paenibacillus castaneae]|uniref:urea transporter n=1 Tax=Paenibacillus castaneae TaxID=474957 RepID=UPI000C9C76AA|nr:urea transporter [Paenibacillus castaneae]NIK79210.1 urea transporter [Paenibacillus castaneae]